MSKIPFFVKCTEDRFIANFRLVETTAFVPCPSSHLPPQPSAIRIQQRFNETTLCNIQRPLRCDHLGLMNAAVGHCGFRFTFLLSHLPPKYDRSRTSQRVKRCLAFRHAMTTCPLLCIVAFSFSGHGSFRSARTGAQNSRAEDMHVSSSNYPPGEGSKGIYKGAQMLTGKVQFSFTSTLKLLLTSHTLYILSARLATSRGSPIRSSSTTKHQLQSSVEAARQSVRPGSSGLLEIN
nr:hypothetical protein CFP56_28761 [Quercus suber]